MNNRNADTKPPPSILADEVRELAAACRNMSALAVEIESTARRLELRLKQHELAILTEEHKTNVAHDRLDRMAREFGRLSAFVNLPPLEPEAAE
jgi:hypothetical protein